MSKRSVIAALISVALLFGCAPSKAECEALDGLGGEVYRSLLSDPGDWQSNGYNLNHKSGLSFWVSNGAGFTRPWQSSDHDEWKSRYSAAPSVSQKCVYAGYLNWREGRQYQPSLRAISDAAAEGGQ